MMGKKILILVNHDVVIYNFRKELVECLLSEGHQVIISSPYGERIDELVAMGCEYVEASIERRGINPIQELKLFSYYTKIMKRIKPDITLTFTIKPNIYGGMASKQLNIPYIANITGLGTAFEKKNFVQRLTIILYKIAFSKIHTIFFQNRDNMKVFTNNNIGVKKHRLLPGSGVNLKDFQVLDYPSDNKIEFVFISRIMKEKGIDEYIEAAKYFTSTHSNVKFHICGFCEEKYEEKLKELENEGVIQYHGMVKDIRTILQQTHCTIHPTYHEGMSNVLLESAACGRPMIASNIPGCREIFDEGISGFGFEAKSANSLIDKTQKFIKLTSQEKINMGVAGRKKVVNEFSRQIVVDAYLEEINKILEEN